MSAVGAGLLGHLLTQLDAAPPSDLIPVAFRTLRTPMRLRHLHLYVADYSERMLLPAPNESMGGEAVSPLSILGSIPGRAYLTREPVEVDGDDGPVVWVPVFRRSETIGVLSFGMEDHDAAIRRTASAVGLMIGAAILEARRHSDVFEVARGAGNLSLAAAVQWDILPVPTYRDARVEVAGRIEPAYDIGGDAFDFASNDGELHLAIFDGMGHGTESSLLSALTVNAYRHARRVGLPLGEIAAEIDRAVDAHRSGEAFVTGHLCKLDVDQGVLAWINVGHPAPLLVRDHVALPLEPPLPMLPFGLHGTPAPPAQVSLQPDDIVLYYSDGITEAHSPTGDLFGMDRFRDICGRHGDPDVPLLILVRQVLDDVMAHAQGRLRDDATLLPLRWRPRA